MSSSRRLATAAVAAATFQGALASNSCRATNGTTSAVTTSSVTASATVSGTADAASSFASAYPSATQTAVDIVIVGGGASGANAAVHFKDAGLSVLVVEKLEQLGGMVNSYTTSNGTTIDYGVAAYTNYTGVDSFFERLGIETTTMSSASVTSSYADYTTGQTINYTASDTAAMAAAFETLYNVSQSYADLYLPSYANWPEPSEIPEDLLMPFREFAEKYDLGAALLLTWSSIGSGLADMLDLPTLYFLQTFPPAVSAAFVGLNVEYVPVSGRNQDIYDTIASILGSDALLLNSTVVDSQRFADDEGAVLVVESGSDGAYTIVSAQRLVLAIEPTSSNTVPFHLDAQEAAVFDVGTWSVVQTGLIQHPSLPVDGMIYNLPADAVDGNYYAYPEPPFVDYIEYMGDGLWQAIAIGWLNFTEADAKQLVQENIDSLAAAGTIPATNGSEVTFVSWSNHGAMDLRTDAAGLQNGYIQNQTALQGHLSTYWTGAAFSNQLSTFLWAYNLEYFVPLVVATF